MKTFWGVKIQQRACLTSAMDGVCCSSRN